MRKNILKFIIIFSLIFNISNSKVFAQNLVENLSDALGIEANKIKGEKLEKLITENYILIGSNVLNGGEAVAEWEFNKDKTYSLTINKEGYREGYNSRQGRWELFGLGNSNIRLYDDSGTKSEMYFEKDGYYRLSQQTYSYRLENKNERIKRLAQIEEEKRIAEEQRLKKIEEEKRQLAAKREQERIKQEEEKKRAQVENQLAAKKAMEIRAEEEKKKLHENILKYSVLGSFFLSISFLIYKYKQEIKDLFLEIKNSYFDYTKMIAEEKKTSSQYKEELVDNKIKQTETFSELSKPMKSLNLKDSDVNKSTIFQMTDYKTFIIIFKKKIEWAKILEFLKKNLDDKNINDANLKFSLHNLRKDGSWDFEETLVGNAMEFICFEKSTLRYQFVNHYKYAEKISNLINKKFSNLEGLKYDQILDVKEVISQNIKKEGKIKLRYKYGWSAIAIFFLLIIGRIFDGSQVSLGKKIDIYDPKNQFYYDDNFRIIPVAVWLTCPSQSMGKSKWLNFSYEVIKNCDSNCRNLGPTIKLCIYGYQ